MSPQEASNLHDLCYHAMSETDVHKLLWIFLELDRATARMPLTELFDKDSPKHWQIGFKDHSRRK